MFSVVTRLAVRPTCLCAALLLGACQTNASAPTGPKQADNGDRGKPLTAGEADPCALLPKAAVEQAVGRPVTKAVPYRSTFVLPGLRPAPATECDFQLEPGAAQRAVHARVGAVEVEAIGAALARFDTAGITRLDVPPAPAVAAYWQGVGRTAWLVGATKVASVQIVTDAEQGADRDAAIAMAAALLSAAQA